MLFTCILICGILWHFYRKEELRSKYLLMNCKIISISSNYKSAPTFECEFFYNGQQKIVGSNTNVNKERIFIGKYFPIAYSPKINVGQILITPEDFKNYDIPFPDSLNWVLEYRY